MSFSVMRLARAVCLAVLVLMPVTMSPASANEGNGTQAVRALYATLLDAMRRGPALGAQGRYARIMPVVNQVFDVPFMTRLAVGPAWAGLSEPQRQQVTQAFERYIAAVYAERFDSFSGERLEVIGTQSAGGGTIVQSVIVKANGEPVHINYLMRQSTGGWQIADIYLNGTISELATRRSEFASILRTGGIDGLIATLNGKAAALGATRTS